MGSAVIEEERAMHPAYLYALSDNSIYTVIRIVTKYTVKRKYFHINFFKMKRETRKQLLNFPF
jgi:hypothetical protein